MAITNGYCTLDELKHRLLSEHAYAYTATTVAFDAAGKTISDTANGLRRFRTGGVLRVSGSASNDGDYDITTGDVDGQIVLSTAPTDEAAGQSVTLTDISDLNDDEALEKVVEAASRAIDTYCKRRFYAATETRTFRAIRSDLCFVEDLLSVTTLKTDNDGDRTYEKTWSTTDYDLLPENAALDGEPYRRVTIAPNGSYTFPTHTKGVQIAGSFGYASTTPGPIREACLLWAMRIWLRKDAVFGIQGSTPLGVATVKAVPPDKDAVGFMRPYIKARVSI